MDKLNPKAPIFIPSNESKAGFFHLWAGNYDEVYTVTKSATENQCYWCNQMTSFTFGQQPFCKICSSYLSTKKDKCNICNTEGPNIKNTKHCAVCAKINKWTKLEFNKIIKKIGNTCDWCGKMAEYNIINEKVPKGFCCVNCAYLLSPVARDCSDCGTKARPVMNKNLRCGFCSDLKCYFEDLIESPMGDHSEKLLSSQFGKICNGCAKKHHIKAERL